MPTVEERVSRLEKVLEDFIISVGIEFNKLYNSQMRTEAELREFKDEMRAFKNEMKEFKNEMKEFKDEMKEFKDEMKEFKDEMKEFKDEMLNFKREQQEENKRRNKEWSSLAKKMGTIVEDLIAPALQPVLSKYFNCDVKMMGQRILKRKDGKDYEVDALAVCDDLVFMVEVKSTPYLEDVKEIKEKSKMFFEFFPEYKDKKLIVIFASITFPENIIKNASKNKIYVMAWRQWEYMDILNFDDIKKLRRQNENKKI